MNKVDYTIVFVKDMSRSITFYRDTLGIPLKFETPYWSEFATEGTTLALHPAENSPAGTCQPGYSVDDIDQFHQKMLDNGITCLQPPSMQEYGMKLAVYQDPDGLVFSISERPKPTQSPK